jgi:hypothetical protein
VCAVCLCTVRSTCLCTRLLFCIRAFFTEMNDVCWLNAPPPLQPFEAINKDVKYGIAYHTNSHVNRGLDDNSLALCLQGMYMQKHIRSIVIGEKKASIETCRMCCPTFGCLGSNSSGETPGEGGRCLRYPKCKEIAPEGVAPHKRQTALCCPHNTNYLVRFRNSEWDGEA